VVRIFARPEPLLLLGDQTLDDPGREIAVSDRIPNFELKQNARIILFHLPLHDPVQCIAGLEHVPLGPFERETVARVEAFFEQLSGFERGAVLTAENGFDVALEFLARAGGFRTVRSDRRDRCAARDVRRCNQDQKKTGVLAKVVDGGFLRSVGDYSNSNR
jgi:hypothetical protein